MSYADAVLQGNLAKLRAAPVGTRNITLAQVAFRLFQFAPMAWTMEAMADVLDHEARLLGLERREIRDTLRSAERGAAKKVLPYDTLIKVAQGRPPSFQAVPREPEPPQEAPDPPPQWQAKAQAFLEWGQDRLWETATPEALEYLVGERGLHELLILNEGLGYNPTAITRSRAAWGLPPDPESGDALYLPAGILLPYVAQQALIKLEIRSIPSGKYTVPGSTNALWGTDRLSPHKPAMLVEGVLNALSVKQAAATMVTPVALGAATHARRVRWIAPLAACPLVLVSTDVGEAGDMAAVYWLDVLHHNARRWRPYVDDVNTMLTAGMDVAVWVQAGLEAG